MMKKIGFFGGTFDPIHIGHLFLALQLAEAHLLDEVWVCPAFCSPFKTSSPPEASADHRLRMVQLAVEPIPNFKVLPIEVEKKKISYTVDTLKELPLAEYHLLLSEESAAEFFQWKEAELLATLAPPLIGCRQSNASFQGWKEHPLLKRGLTPTHTIEISSTEIRRRLKNKLYCGHLVPAKALDYILEHQLYFC